MQLAPVACSGALAAALVLASCASAPLAGGRGAPDLSRVDARTPEGATVALTGPGPARLVEVWATWCEPCARAAAVARPVVARHPRVAAFALAVDGERRDLDGYGASAVGRLLVVRGGEAAALRAGLDRFPTFIVLDARGNAVGHVIGTSPQLAANLERLLRSAEGGVGDRF